MILLDGLSGVNRRFVRIRSTFLCHFVRDTGVDCMEDTLGGNVDAGVGPRSWHFEDFVTKALITIQIFYRHNYLSL